VEALHLRDIHLPTPIALWPLAEGWWVIIGLLFIALCIGAYLLYRHHQPTALKQALAALESILENRSLSVEVQNQSISLLLRQLAVTTYGREDVASLIGPAWVAWVEGKLRETPLSPQMRAFLALGAYSPSGDTIQDPASFRIEIKTLFLTIGKPLSLTVKLQSIKDEAMKVLHLDRFTSKASKI
jgi:Domain of unknown function (DUF4381)